MRYLLLVEFQVQLTFKSHQTSVTFEWESEILNTTLQLNIILRQLLTRVCDVSSYASKLFCVFDAKIPYKMDIDVQIRKVNDNLPRETPNVV